MKRKTKMRIWAWLLTVCLCLGILPADMFGGIGSVQAETTTESGVVKTVEDNTTTWDFTGTDASGASATGTVQGITMGSGTIKWKECLDLYGEQHEKSNGTSYVILPLDSTTTSVDLTITLTTTGGNDDTYGTRYVKVGNDTNSVSIYHKATDASGTAQTNNFESGKTWTGTLDSSYFTDNTLMIYGMVGENKIGSIKIVETKSASGDNTGGTGEEDTGSGESGNTGSGETTVAGPYAATYILNDASVIPAEGDGTAAVTSADGKFTISSYTPHTGGHGPVVGSANTVTIKAYGKTTIQVGQCSYGDGTVTLTKDGAAVGEAQSLKGTGCGKNDASNAVTLTYEGTASAYDLVLTFAGSCYLPFVKVTCEEPEEDNTGSGGATESGAYAATYTLNDNSVIPAEGDGTAAVTSADGKFTISSYTPHSGGHGPVVGAANTVTIKAYGKTTIQVGQCSYGDGTVTLTKDGAAVGEAKSMKGTGCGKNDASNAVTLTYEGTASAYDLVLTFAGSCYLPFVKVTCEEPEEDNTGSGGATESGVYAATYTLNDTSVIPAEGDGTAAVTSADGKFTISSYTPHTGGHGPVVGAANTVTIKAYGKTTIQVGQCSYGDGTVTLTKDGAAVGEVQSLKGTGCGKNDASNAVTLTYEGKASAYDLVLTFTGSCYLPFVKVTCEEPEYVEKEDDLSTGEYALDVTLEGNNVTDTTKWSESGGWYVLHKDLSSDKIVQSNGIFGYWPTGSKVKMKDGLGGIQLDGSVNKNGQAAIEIDLTNVPEGTYGMELTYCSKSEGTESKVKLGNASGVNEVGSTNTSKTNPVVYTTTLESGAAYLVGAANGMVVKSLKVSLLAEKEVFGTVSCATGTDFPETCSLTFTELDGTGKAIEGKSYTADINVEDGSYSVVLPAASYETKYSVTFSDSEYIFSPDVDSITVVKGESGKNDFTIVKASVYNLTGSYKNGLGDDWTKLTKLIFKPATTSAYTDLDVTLDQTTGTYSVRLEKGTTYNVTAEGVNDYTVVTEAVNYSEDTSLDLEFAEKTKYPITISLGSTPDLTNKQLVYTFVHEDGTVYTFDSSEEIKLRDGNYKISVGGDLNEMAYDVKTGMTLSVSGVAVNHAITFKPLTSWSFANDAFTTDFQVNTGATGYYKGLFIDATTGSGKLAPHSSNTAVFNEGAKITVPVTGPCTVYVTAYQSAEYAAYAINGVQASTDGATTAYEYTGEAGTIDIVANGNPRKDAYIASISLEYPAKDVETVEQEAMPFVPENDADANTAADTDGIPRQNKKDNMVVQPVGQKLNFSQSGGKFADKFKDTADVTYYLFPKTSGVNKLEFDLLVTESKATGNDAGFFGGLFTDNYVYSIGLRAGGTKIRGIYSKNGGIVGGSFAGAGSPNEELVGLNREIHYVITYDKANAKPKVDITFVDDAGELQTRSWSQGALAEPDGNVPTEFYYGFALANVSATITNMKYTDAEGKVVYYDQNACYKAEGATPVASAVTMTVAESKEYIDVNWTGTVPEGDATYVVEMQKDGGAWVQLSEDVTGFTYRYTLPAGEAGNYKFRVCGQLGKAPLGGSRNDYVEMAEAQYVVAALSKPKVEISATATDITVDWSEIGGADYYQVFRYSFDEGEEGILLVADRLVKTSFVDEEIKTETPYYYLVKAISEAGNNESPYSDLVWAVASAGHTGEYVYEDEATEIFIAKKSYDTVFTNKVVLEGNVYGDGKLEAVVNDEVVASKEMANGDAFAFNLTVVPGRNDVNLLFTDEAGNITRETFNFVYLTNYDIVVDASYTGTDGEAVNGIPTYKTVQAAVNAVPSSNTARKVILVMAGSYEERLEVKSPYITLIGEDRENTSIHCYPGTYQDMATRCATYVYSSATAFSAENITFANDCVYAEHPEQADAIRVEPDNATFVNVGFKGVQDTLYMHSGKQYYYKCVIEGLIDFIYSGDAARAFFNDCEIIFVYEATKTSGYVSAPKTAESATYGLTFYNCVITSEEGCAGPGYLLARPWGPNAYIAWINCYMGDVINETQPYNSMSGNMAEDARFFEFGSYGPGYEINVNRRQISPAKAEEMISTSFLGWDPASVIATISADSYVGNITTDREDQTQESERVDKHYAWTDGDDTGLKMYDMEGYAAAYEVTGGGLLKEGSEGYYEVDSAEEFLNALIASKNDGVDSVIELTADINLGCNEIENFADYNSVIKAYSAQPLTHPTLIETGVSQLNFDKVYNLTIFSSNASSIKHANITMKNSENIIIRNVKFDELWEWDEATNGDYDRNDWDFMTIDSTSNGIWIDHCTFYKAYDGIIDIKNPAPTANVTISWCEFLPGSEGNVFFEEMMNDVYANPDKYPTTYQHMKEEGMTDSQIYMYAYAQKKTHLLGQSDDATSAAGIRLTLANNYYKDSMDRLPRLRYGKAHVYNCIMDAQTMLDVRQAVESVSPDIAKKIVSNGAISTCGAEVLLENCYINGIQNAMNSGNGSSPAGYINAINSLYYMDGVATKLEPKNNNTLKDGTLVTDAPSFIANLPYADYELYDAADLYGIVKYNAGAGKLELTTLQWEKVSYNAEWEDPDVQEEHPNVNSGASDDSDDSSSSDDSSASENITIDWVEVKAEVETTADKTTSQSANVNLNYTSTGETKVPTNVLNEIKGENVTVAFQSGNGVALSISGQKLNGVDLSKIQNVDLTVTNEPNVIPDLAVASKPAVAKRELSIKDTGNFGVAVDMHINVGKENAGKVANLYRYNPTSGKLEFCSHFVITAEGQSMFAIGRGGDYLITVTNTTVNETAWYFGGDYTVQAGDNLSKIAVRYHMPLAELIRRNPQLTNLNMIKPGQKLNLK